MEAERTDNLNVDGEKMNEKRAKNAGKGPLLDYADSKDMLLMTLGCLGCMADGATTPLIMLALSRITNNLAANPSSLTLHRIKEDSMVLIYIAMVVGVGAFFDGAATFERNFFWPWLPDVKREPLIEDRASPTCYFGSSSASELDSTEKFEFWI